MNTDRIVRCRMNPYLFSHLMGCSRNLVKPGRTWSWCRGPFVIWDRRFSPLFCLDRGTIISFSLFFYVPSGFGNVDFGCPLEEGGTTNACVWIKSFAAA